MRVIDFRLRPPFGAFRDLIVFRDSVRTARLSKGLGFDLAPSVQTRSMDLLLSEMDAGSVKCGVITGRTDTVFGSVGNDVIEQVVAAYPGKFIGIAYIAPHNRKVAIEEIERAMAAGFKGVVIEPGLAQPPMYLDDGRLYPVYAHLEDRKIPLVFMAGGNAGPDTTYSSPNISIASPEIFRILRSSQRTAIGRGSVKSFTFATGARMSISRLTCICSAGCRAQATISMPPTVLWPIVLFMGQPTRLCR